MGVAFLARSPKQAKAGNVGASCLRVLLENTRSAGTGLTTCSAGLRHHRLWQ